MSESRRHTRPGAAAAGEQAGAPMPSVRIVDLVVDQIALRLGDVPPEQGGALLGSPDGDLVTAFIHDADAATSGVIYHNTDWLIHEIERVEQNTAARFKGIVHSHPQGTPVPSGQDRGEYALSLRMNPELPRYLAPIVTHDVSSAPRGHELIFRRARMSFFGMSLREGEPVLQRLHPRVIPLMRMLERAGIAPDAEPALVRYDGALLLATNARIPDLGAASMLFGTDFPTTPPIVMPHDAAAPVSMPWDLGVRTLDRLDRAIRDVREARRSARHGRGKPSSGRAPQPQPGVSEPAPKAEAADAAEPDTLYARSTGLLSRTLSDRRALIVGAGSVGSYLAEALTRSGVGSFTLVDPERVEPENLGRSAYRVDDVGRSKVAALADLILAINPRAAVDVHPVALEALSGEDLSSITAASDLVVAATDDNAAQERLGHFAYWERRPAVFPALYRGAAGGEVVSVFDELPCWSCSTGGVRKATRAGDEPQRATDYGTGRLVSEPGLLVDVQHVASAAAKIALGLLHEPGQDVSTARFVAGMREAGRNFVAFANEPDYWIFPSVLGSSLGQYAFQSIWLETERDPACPVCGDPQGRTDPRSYRAPTASLEAINDMHRVASTQGEKIAHD